MWRLFFLKKIKENIKKDLTKAQKCAAALFLCGNRAALGIRELNPLISRRKKKNVKSGKSKEYTLSVYFRICFQPAELFKRPRKEF